MTWLIQGYPLWSVAGNVYASRRPTQMVWRGRHKEIQYPRRMHVADGLRHAGLAEEQSV